MPATQSCTPCCTTPQSVEIPGPEGDAGINGADGQNAFTTTTASFNVPSVGNTVVVAVQNSNWMVAGQVVVTDGPAHFLVDSIGSPTSVTLEFLGYAGDVAPSSTVASGSKVSPSGVASPLSAPLPTSLTDNSTGTASNTIAAGVGVSTLVFPLSSLATGIVSGAMDIVTGFTPGYRFKLLAFGFVTTIVGAGAGASQVFNLEINSTDVTGGVLTLNLAATDTVGENTAATAITADNVGSATDTISIEKASGGTVFTSGAGFFWVQIQNMDTADAVASLAEHVNDLITSLTP
jgi:hypothetical protein